MNVSGTLGITHVSATDRERFLAALFNGPLRLVDAVVVFSGDGKKRLDAAIGILRQRAAHWCVVSGGVDNPPHSLDADAAAKYLIERGLHPDRIVRDNASQNTHEQAEWLAEKCATEGWGSALLVASPYHTPRAFLTVLASLQSRNLTEDVMVLPLPAGECAWWERPDGLDVTRMDLFADELRKIDEYGARGHVASYEDGLRYLAAWECVEEVPGDAR